MRWQDHADPAAEIREAAERGIAIVTQDDEDYPAPLRDTYDPPLLLYVWGKIEARDRHAIGVVGSRRATHYGTQATKKLSYQLAQSGFTIISGLARGIDTAAHEAAIAASGRTIAVIGSGLGKLYPPENLGLAEKIAAGNRRGGFRVPAPHRAGQADVSDAQPHRRRLGACAVSRGMPGVVGFADHRQPGHRIWQAGVRRARTDRQTDLRRVQPTHPRRGHAGADASHILDDLGELPFARKASAAEPAAEIPELPEEEAAVFAAVTTDEAPVDRIIERCGLPAHVVSATLMKLEMRRLVRAFPGFRYARR